MSSIETYIHKAVSVEVKPVRYRVSSPGDGPLHTWAAQRLVVKADDGTVYELCLYLEEGSKSLAEGEVVCLPSPKELEGSTS